MKSIQRPKKKMVVAAIAAFVAAMAAGKKQVALKHEWAIKSLPESMPRSCPGRFQTQRGWRERQRKGRYAVLAYRRRRNAA